MPLLLSEKKEGIEEEFYRADMKADSSHHICTDVHALWTNSLQSEALCNCLFAHGQNTWHYAWVWCWTMNLCVFDGQLSRRCWATGTRMWIPL